MFAAYAISSFAIAIAAFSLMVRYTFAELEALNEHARSAGAQL